MNKKKLAGVISLGCDKNRVDTERALSELSEDFEITNDIDQAQLIVVNTCAFLASARREAIDTILECADKKNNKLEKLIVSGCLPQKFSDELIDTLPEVDAFLGTDDYGSLREVIKLIYAGKRVNLTGKGVPKTFGRYLSTPPHYAYLKIADGCDNRCTYCLIPAIRGKYVSYPEDGLVKEASQLGDVKELILVAQDTTRYGEDGGKNRFVALIRKLTALDNIGSVRLLYCYPDRVSDELIAELAQNDKLLKYIDIPLQHASADLLRRMNRRGNGDEYLKLIERLRAEVNGIAVRSTFIVGFPGESDEDIETLKSFVRQAKLFNAGFFAYSREPNTPAYSFEGQIPARVKQSRLKQLYAVQREISAENLKQFVGKTIRVLSDGIDYDNNCFTGRAYFSAPEIDGKVLFTSERLVEQGEYYDVEITKSNAYDLMGKCK